MQLRILIKTPVGMAEPESIKIKLIKKLFLKKAKVIKEQVNSDKSQIIYTVEIMPRNFLKVTQSINMWKVFTKELFKNKVAKKALRRLADDEDTFQSVKELITEGTEIEILKP